MTTNVIPIAYARYVSVAILVICRQSFKIFTVFFFNDTATTEIYTLSLHDALPICDDTGWRTIEVDGIQRAARCDCRSEEHTSELQSQSNLVCRLLLEKKKSAYRDRCQHYCPWETVQTGCNSTFTIARLMENDAKP